MFARSHAPPPPIGRRRATLMFVSVLLFGLLVMLIAAAIGSTEGFSRSPWVEGEVIFYATPLLVAACGYRLLRRRGMTPRRALIASVALVPGLVLLVALSYTLLVLLG
jgi:drug/metabolite transporter (DMT)-like permease